ncbi:MAG: DinB family protein [Planctomycetota bacterium]
MSTQTETIGPMFAASCRLGLGYADRLLAGVSSDQFAKFAQVGDQLIESNHPCFILGHLSLYPCRVVAEHGFDATPILPSDEFVRVFNKDAKCVHDSDGTIYPPMDLVVSKFRSTYERAIEALESADDSNFHQPNANEAMRAKFPTVGAMHGFYVGGHIMMHMGQISAWRRMMGLGPA